MWPSDAIDLVNTGSENTLLTDLNKPLPETLVINETYWHLAEGTTRCLEITYTKILLDIYDNTAISPEGQLMSVQKSKIQILEYLLLSKVKLRQKLGGNDIFFTLVIDDSITRTETEK